MLASAMSAAIFGVAALASSLQPPVSRMFTKRMGATTPARAPSVWLLSSLNNARLVGRVGLTTLIRRMAVIGVVLAALLTLVSFTNGGRPNFWLFSFALAITVPLAQGLVPNANTAAMMPMAHVAGTAAAVIGTITTAGGALIGSVVSGAFDGTVRPIAVGILALLSVSAALVLFGATSRVQSTREVAVDAS